jgi:uncharacterized coiled-coil protein SlyX
MFDFFGFKKTRARLHELEYIITKQHEDIKSLEQIINQLRDSLENEISSHLTLPAGRTRKKKPALEKSNQQGKQK